MEQEIQTGGADDVTTDQQQTDTETFDLLKYGLLSPHLPNLQKCKSQLGEVTRSQTELVESVERENRKFEECKCTVNLDQMIRMSKEYHNKLIGLRRNMNTLHERATKLKKRAVRLQQARHKEVVERELKRERELEEERRITAKPAAKPVGPPATKPVGAPAAKPVGAPAAKPVGAPAAKPVGAPAAKPVGAPAAKPAGVPAAKPPASLSGGEPSSTAAQDKT